MMGLETPKTKQECIDIFKDFTEKTSEEKFRILSDVFCLYSSECVINENRTLLFFLIKADIMLHLTHVISTESDQKLVDLATQLLCGISTSIRVMNPGTDIPGAQVSESLIHSIASGDRNTQKHSLKALQYYLSVNKGAAASIAYNPQLCHLTEILRAPTVEESDLDQEGSETKQSVLAPPVTLSTKVGLLNAAVQLLSHDILVPHAQHINRTAGRITKADLARLQRLPNPLPPPSSSGVKKSAPTSAHRSAYPSQFTSAEPDSEQEWTDLALAASALRTAYRRFAEKNKMRFDQQRQLEEKEKEEDDAEVSDDSMFSEDKREQRLITEVKMLRETNAHLEHKADELKEVAVKKESDAMNREAELERQLRAVKEEQGETSLEKLAITKHTQYITFNKNVIRGYSSNTYGILSFNEAYSTGIHQISFSVAYNSSGDIMFGLFDPDTVTPGGNLLYNYGPVYYYSNGIYTKGGNGGWNQITPNYGDEITMEIDLRSPAKSDKRTLHFFINGQHLNYSFRKLPQRVKFAVHTYDIGDIILFHRLRHLSAPTAYTPTGNEAPQDWT